MILEDLSDVTPLHSDGEGGFRIGNSRVTLDTLASAYDQGATADEIVRRYPVLDLSEVYMALGFLVKHEELVREYLERRAKDARELRRKLEAEGIVLSESKTRERLREKRGEEAKLRRSDEGAR